MYELGPDGLEFAGPVTITRLVDPEAVGTDIDVAMPVVLLALRDSDGAWEWLEDQVIQLDPDDPSKVRVTGTTNHFSTVVAFAGPMEVSMELDPQGDLKVGEGFISEVAAISRVQIGDVDVGSRRCSDTPRIRGRR